MSLNVRSLPSLCNVHNWVSPQLMDPMGLRVTNIAYFSLLAHIKQLLFVTFCDMITGIGSKTGQDGADDANDGRTDRHENVEIVRYVDFIFFLQLTFFQANYVFRINNFY